MKTHCWVSGLAVATLVLTSSLAEATRPEAAPSVSVAVEKNGAAHAAFKFDLSGLAASVEAGRSIFLEWDIDGVPAEGASEYALYPLDAAFTGATTAEGLDLAEEPLATWVIEDRDYEAAGGFVRFEVTWLVEAWLTQQEPNNGVVVVTDAVGDDALATQLGSARLVAR
jgi:hypothetical protein